MATHSLTYLSELFTPSFTSHDQNRYMNRLDGAIQNQQQSTLSPFLSTIEPIFIITHQPVVDDSRYGHISSFIRLFLTLLFTAVTTRIMDTRIWVTMHQVGQS